ncbi:MAG: transporter substrate-binding domain-containing protein [Syntrophomonadaceae bacterium]|nr:transporter substrate-binding domain-containing protein [Syntrophomonadaceae bacterium]MDD3899024.1 transporter substrate-binding domain-containing protein [Syntrophomonadaceae bacterium]
MKKVVKLVLCAILVMGLCITAVGCQGSGSSDEFKVGLECGYPPFNWTQIDDSNGAVPIDGTKEFAGGYDVEIAKLLAEGMGKELVIVKTSWSGLPPAVQSGKIDGIIAGMSPTAERKMTIDFSDPYYSSDLVIVVQKGSKYENATSIKDFAGAKITAQLDTFHYTVIDQIPDVDIKPAMDDFPAMRVALESGIIDGYISEKPEAISATTANAKFGMAEFAKGQGFKYTPDDVAIAVGLKKGNTELAEKINKILAGLSQEERVEIMNQAVLNQPAAK